MYARFSGFGSTISLWCRYSLYTNYINTIYNYINKLTHHYHDTPVEGGIITICLQVRK